MDCLTHAGEAAIGFCAECRQPICRRCVGTETPRRLCQRCVAVGQVLGFEYRSSLEIAGWPLIHVCTGVNPVTRRPRAARGVIAIGNIAVGAVAIGAFACGLVAVGGASVGLLACAGGTALGLGVSIGGLAVGSVAFGGVALGFVYAVGGMAFAPSAIDDVRCDPAAREFLARWVGAALLPPTCQ